MSPHLSPELRECIIYWRYELNKTALEISVIAGCSEHTIYNVLQLHREFGQVSNPYACSKGRTQALNMGDTSYIASLITANPSIYLDELQEKLMSVHGVEASISTISHALRHLAISHKNVAVSALE
ncbi:hypothetical protein BDQ17DRAFT_1251398 [Cyathus striatus]|nr:hypothetical protein BDQ17DRAFT_1251398 [Cyathus striatus]